MKKEPKRTFEKPLQVRVSSDQYALYSNAAVKDGRSLSNWARDRLDKAASAELKGTKV